MKKHNIILLGVCALILGLTSCKSSSTAAYYSSEPECLGIERDGSQTLRVWATGRNKSDAVEQAKKDAVWYVTFKGVTLGSGDCSSKPLLTEVNAQEKYEYYFNSFFKDDGEYLKYISMEDTRVGTKTRESRDVQVKYGVTVRVLRSELRQRFVEDGLLNP